MPFRVPDLWPIYKIGVSPIKKICSNSATDLYQVRLTISKKPPCQSNKLAVNQVLKYAYDLGSDTVGRRSGRHGGLVVSALDSGSKGPGLRPGGGHCVVFLGKTLYSHSASLHLAV